MSFLPVNRTRSEGRDRPAEQANDGVESSASDVRSTADELPKQGEKAPAHDVERAAGRVDALSSKGETHMTSGDAPDRLGEDAEVNGARDGHATENDAAARPYSAEPGRPLIATNEASSDGGRQPASARAVVLVGLEPFAVDVQRRDDVAIVQPRGELDLATVETLRAALDDIEGAGRLVLDLRGLSFIDSTGLHLLGTLHQRAQRDGFQLTLLAPAAPVDRTIRLCGLDQVLPFEAPVDAVDSESGESTSGLASGERGQP